MAKAEEGYKNHRAGSRKGKVHQEFDRRGKDAALALAKKLKLKKGTVTSWFPSWRTKNKPAVSSRATNKSNKKGKASGRK